MHTINLFIFSEEISSTSVKEQEWIQPDISRPLRFPFGPKSPQKEKEPVSSKTVSSTSNDENVGNEVQCEEKDAQNKRRKCSQEKDQSEKDQSTTCSKSAKRGMCHCVVFNASWRICAL